MRILMVTLLTHVVIVGMWPAPWWVPDLTTIGLVLAVSKTPSRWLAYAGCTGVLLTVWAIRHPAAVEVSCLLIGWGTQLTAQRWDAGDLRVQCLLIGMASALMTLWALWLEDLLGSLPLVGLVGLRVTLTCLAVPLVRSLLVPRGS